MTVKIYTNPTDQPEFIPVQLQMFRRFLKTYTGETWDYTVLSHAGSPEKTQKLARVCELAGVKHHALEKESLSWINNVDHSIAMQQTYDGWCLQDRGVDLIIHNDMFLFKETNLNSYLEDAHVAAVHQNRGEVEYLSSHMLILDMGKIPRRDKLDMSCGVIRGEHVDVCGYTHYWLRETPEARVKWMSLEWLSDPATREKYLTGDLQKGYDPTWSCEILGGRFLHYARGTNWDRQPESWVQAKREWFARWVEHVCKPT